MPEKRYISSVLFNWTPYEHIDKFWIDKKLLLIPKALSSYVRHVQVIEIQACKRRIK